MRDGRLALLLPGDGPSATARRIAAELRPLLEQPPTVAAAGPSTGPQQVRRSWQEATRCLGAEYFVAGSSPTYAAQALFVHPNTVSRRLERITELLGARWQTPAQSLEIQQGLRLHRTRDSLGR